MAAQPTFPVPLPFQSYASIEHRPLANLTWQTCFDFREKNDILSQFVTPLRDAPSRRGQFTWSVRARADMLAYMLNLEGDRPDSIAITRDTEQALEATEMERRKNTPSSRPKQWIKVTPLSEADSELPRDNLGYVQWFPPKQGRTLGKRELDCYTVYDLLASCMSDAATAEGCGNHGRDFFECLLSLFAHWCSIIKPNPDFRPTTVCIGNIRDSVVLGATIPNVPNFRKAKENIQKARKALLIGLFFKKDGYGKRRAPVGLEPKIMEGAQLYGNCAETTLFPLLHMLDNEDKGQAQGLALLTPARGQFYVDATTEKIRQIKMCDNCHRMAKLCVENDAGRNGQTIVYDSKPSGWWCSRPSLGTDSSDFDGGRTCF